MQLQSETAVCVVAATPPSPLSSTQSNEVPGLSREDGVTPALCDDRRRRYTLRLKSSRPKRKTG